MDKALAGEFTSLLSVSSVLQYEAVLKRAEHRAVHNLTDARLDQVIGSLVHVGAPVQIGFLWRPVLSDPSNDMILATAVNGQADLLVTFNPGDFARAAMIFAHRHPSSTRCAASSARTCEEVVLIGGVMRQSSFPLRLAASLQEEARKTAESEGISLNQLFNLAIAEKISALRTEEFFRERGARAGVRKARKLLKRVGKETPREGDEVA